MYAFLLDGDGSNRVYVLKVEDARAKEMQRHGELLDAVQRQLDGSRRNEKELLVMVAKLRADKCQHDAEMAALRAKTKQTEDSAQASDQRQRLVNEDWRERIDGKDRVIAELKATVERLQGAVADGAVQQSVSRTQVEGLERDNQRLHAEHAELEKRYEVLGLILDRDHIYSEWIYPKSLISPWPSTSRECAITCSRLVLLHPRSEMTTSSPKKRQPLFDSPSKYGVHHAISAFTPTEERFKWQSTSNPTDALYALPTSIGTGSKKSFGTSTREDWDPSRKRSDDCAGPGSYKSVGSCGRQPSSLCRNSSVTAFENASRSSLHSDATPSPGPIYDLATTVGTAPSPKFGTAKRMPLNGKSEGPGPNLMLPTAFKEHAQGVAPTFGTEKRMRPGAGSGGSAPGPIYDLTTTGFRTGSVITFSKAKRF
ncbi:hypothetical protein Poli38472_002755 [Pythium oligandrum]|uniref:Uncharacterized protein n=1 Tax=Pythium oligandrum TaxID=41045 RepID=A0A8K1CIR9_PYTOL|nr:hypothetical protein Poli38472_002755 [Pythium oligandrum]|eukprot:TMW63814.1 hypothetical protein Poli38472_002755 [Pythium oligandrum]